MPRLKNSDAKSVAICDNQNLRFALSPPFAPPASSDSAVRQTRPLYLMPPIHVVTARPCCDGSLSGIFPAVSYSNTIREVIVCYFAIMVSMSPSGNIASTVIAHKSRSGTDDSTSVGHIVYANGINRIVLIVFHAI